MEARILLSQLLLWLLVAMTFAAPAPAQEIPLASDTLVGWPRDPVYVYYPRASCRGDEIDLQIWSRRDRKWVAHPAHARIPIESCQLEDAGVLWNELRWRCVEPSVPGELPAAWVKGIDVFAPEVMERCAVSRDGDGFGAMRIVVASPSPEMPLRAADPIVDVEGSVRLGGLGGADYDVVLAIDISGGEDAGERVRAQVDASRRFVERVRPRLGATRVGVVTYPNVRPGRGEHTGARAEIHLSASHKAIDRALAAIARRGAAGSSNFPSGLAFGLDELQRVTLDGSGARPHARKLLLISADGTDAMPFGADVEQNAAQRAQVVSLAQRAKDSGVAIYLYAIGGIAAETSALVTEMMRENRGSFMQVKRPRETREYLSGIRMPYIDYVAIQNMTTGHTADGLKYGSGGDFRATIPVAFGSNRLRIEARSSDDERALLIHEFAFDGTLVQERLRRAERERVDRMRRRREVTIDVPKPNEATEEE